MITLDSDTNNLPSTSSIACTLNQGYFLRPRVTNQSIKGKKLTKRKRLKRNTKLNDKFVECDNSNNVKIKKNSKNNTFREEIDAISSSLESISLLKECYEEKEKNDFPVLTETCMNSQIEIVKINSDEDTEDDWCLRLFTSNTDSSSSENCDDHQGKKIIKKVDNFTQTDFSIFSNVEKTKLQTCMSHNLDFVASVVTLKSIIKSKSEIKKKDLIKALDKNISTDRKLCSMSSLSEDEEKNFYSSDSKPSLDITKMPGDTIKYIIREANVDVVFLDTVKSLLTCFETALKTDIENISRFWKNSIYELATDVLNKAFEIEPSLEKIISAFLKKIITSILNNDNNENSYQESKAEFVIIFCQRKPFVQHVINHVINELKKLNKINKMKNSTSLDDKLILTRFIKNSYYLLQILEKLLLVFKLRHSDEKLRITNRDDKLENFNVLDIWKKRWNRGRGEIKKNQTLSDCFNENLRNKWCDDLDDILIFCIDNFPILSKSVENCSALAKDVAKCHESHSE